MSKFVKGQTVVCVVDQGMISHLKQGEKYFVDDVKPDARTIKIGEHYFGDYRFQSLDEYNFEKEPGVVLDKQDGSRLDKIPELIKKYTPEYLHDPVNHPKHYTKHPSGVECIQITEHMDFCLGNAIKYIWRAGEKNATVEDLKKAKWYLERKIKQLEGKKDEQ